MARGELIGRMSNKRTCEGFAISSRQPSFQLRETRVDSPSAVYKKSGQQQKQQQQQKVLLHGPEEAHDGDDDDDSSSAVFNSGSGGCRRFNSAAVTARLLRAAPGQIGGDVQRQSTSCDHELCKVSDTMETSISAVPLLNWESILVRSCRSSTWDTLVCNRKFHAAVAQQVDSRSQQYPEIAAACMYSDADEQRFHKGQMLPLDFRPRRLKVVAQRLKSDEKRVEGERQRMRQSEPDSTRSSFVRNTDHVEAQGTVDETAAAAATLHSENFSGANLSHPVFQPSLYSKKLCLKSSSSPHGAPVETTALDSRSSSFRSQSSFVAWETSGDKDSGADSSSPGSTTSLQGSTVCFKGNDDDLQYVAQCPSTQDDPVDHLHAPHQVPGFAKDFRSCRKQAAEVTRTSSALATLLRPWKILFGTKKSCKLPSSRDSAEHTENRARQLSSEASTSPIVSWSAPMHKTASSLSPARNQLLLRQKKPRIRSIPYFAEQEVPVPFTPAPTATEAAPEDEQLASASVSSSSTAGGKDGTRRQFRRESSLHNVHNIRNSPASLLPTAPPATPATPKSSLSLNAKAHKEPRLTHSQSAIMSTCSSPGVGFKPGHDDDDDCATTPKLPSTERWKKYVKMLKPLHPKPSPQTHESLHKSIEHIRITGPPASSAATVTATTTTTSSSSLLHIAASPLCPTPSRRRAYGTGTGSNNLPPLKLKTTIMSSSAASEPSSTKAVATTTSSSKISRIIASSVMTPRSKSVTPTYRVIAAAAATAINNQSTICEQHNAVQGAIAHCKQSQSGQLNLHSIS